MEDREWGRGERKWFGERGREKERGFGGRGEGFTIYIFEFQIFDVQGKKSVSLDDVKT